MFKRYECGCIGLVTRGMPGPGERKQVRCIKPCDVDRDDETPTLFRRDALQDKPSRMLTDDELEALLDEEIAPLLRDGHRYRELRHHIRALVD